MPVIDYDQSLTMAIRKMEGGRAAFLHYVQLAAEQGDDDATKFLVCFSELKIHEQQRASLDLVCIAAGVSRVDLLKTMVGVAFAHNIEVGNLVAIAAHPGIVERTVQSARRLKSSIGQKDRQNLLIHAGFLPSPKGTVVNVTAAASASAASAAMGAEPSVPRFLDDVASTTGPRDVIQREIIEGVVVQRAAVAALDDEDPVEWPT